MNGPISARVPVKISLSPNSPISYVLGDTELQLSRIDFENVAMKALSNASHINNIPIQAVFDWKPSGSDLSSRRIACHDKQAAPAILAFREDLSSPAAHDYGLLFEVYDHGGHIAMYPSWDDKLVSADLLTQLIELFENFLTLMVKGKCATVQELFSENRAGRSGDVDDSRPGRHGLPPI